MKYVSRDEDGALDFTRYDQYLADNRAALTALVRGDELLTIDRFIPPGRRSFHDARFESVSIATDGNGGPNSRDQRLEVILHLRGPYFDRFFELSYTGVVLFSFDAPHPADDLLVHELRSENGSLIHELLFDNGKTLVITCEELRFVETLEADQSSSSLEQPD